MFFLKYKFNTHVKWPNELVLTYVSQLQALAAECKYPAAFVDQLVLDRIVCRTNNQQVQRRLLGSERTNPGRDWMKL